METISFTADWKVIAINAGNGNLIWDLQSNKYLEEEVNFMQIKRMTKIMSLFLQVEKVIKSAKTGKLEKILQKGKKFYFSCPVL